MGRGQGKTNTTVATTEGFRRVLGTQLTPPAERPVQSVELTPEMLDSIAPRTYATHEVNVRLPEWAQGGSSGQEFLALTVAPAGNGSFEVVCTECIIDGSPTMFSARIGLLDDQVLTKSLHISVPRPPRKLEEALNAWLDDFVRRWVADNPLAMEAAHRTELRAQYERRLGEREAVVRKVEKVQRDIDALTAELLRPPVGPHHAD